ncbi:Armadillo-like helical [Penicillium malachiteum]|uniref:Armadillo-like helical n=1 Tax=Penicillium malachiteum TaxID=1324776 RepID=UPI002547BA71|nr:Armadillo-like helical [Penicillium malachiteum]KAJ5713304.1 Armadillo-like helical [Penicillium malachiteum]
MAFLIDSYQSYALAGPSELDPVFRKTFVLVQKAHFRTANIARLEAAIRVYAALSGLNPLREDILKKLTPILLHPFPRVRSSAAEYLYMMTSLETVKYENWSASPKELKGKVDGLRDKLVTAN